MTKTLIILILKQSAYPAFKLLPQVNVETRYQVQQEIGFDNIIVVDGIPIIDKSKLEKLLAKIGKEFSRKGAPIKVDDIFVPWDDSTGKSKGYAFSEIWFIP